MTASHQEPPDAGKRRSIWAANSPAPRWLKGQSIGSKLTLGFSVLVVLTLLVAMASLVAGNSATATIRNTNEQRFPIALAASRAQADLLRMQSSVRGYLALGERDFRVAYAQAQLAFDANLADLAAQRDGMSPLNQNRLAELEQHYAEWSALPEQLFDLRDDRLAREPAYQILATDGVLYGGGVLLDVQQLIEAEALRQPVTADSLGRLRDMASFQGSFAAMLSGLRNYVTTQNRAFRQEFEANLVLNDIQWESLLAQRSNLTANQQKLLGEIELNRDLFLDLPQRQIFPLLEAEDGRFRQDLYLFRQEAVPKADLILALLTDITTEEQTMLARDLQQGSRGLRSARVQTIVWGSLAVIAGMGLAVILRSTIVGPVGLLTSVAEQIRGGDLAAHAQVVFDDEVGLLARTFNRMTARLRETLLQVRKEKKRADDLLNVVIPIGVDLSSETDLDRLLEKILLEAKAFCSADAGSLYLRTPDDQLQFVIVRNDTQHLALGGTTGKPVPFPPLPLYDDDGEQNWRNVAAYVALSGQSMNIEEVYTPDGTLTFTGPRDYDRRTGYSTRSMLTIPLSNVLGQVIGVLQLINAKDADSGEIVPFDEHLEQMMRSFSSLAVAALEAYKREQALRQEIQQLRIEIDEVKLQQQVRETVETDFFQDLQAKAQDIRQRRRQARKAQES